MCIFHKWGRWEQYDTVKLSYFFTIPCKQTVTHQKRICWKCGKMQDEFVSTSEFVSLTENNIHNQINVNETNNLKDLADAVLNRKYNQNTLL